MQEAIITDPETIERIEAELMLSVYVVQRAAEIAGEQEPPE